MGSSYSSAKYRRMTPGTVRKVKVTAGVAVVIVLWMVLIMDWNPLPKPPSKAQLMKKIELLGSEHNVKGLDSLYRYHESLFSHDNFNCSNVRETLTGFLLEKLDSSETSHRLCAEMVMDNISYNGEMVRNLIIDKLVSFGNEQWASLRQCNSYEGLWTSSKIGLDILHTQDPAIPFEKFLVHKDSLVRSCASLLLYASGNSRLASVAYDTVPVYSWGYKDTLIRYNQCVGKNIVDKLLLSKDSKSFCPLFQSYVIAREREYSYDEDDKEIIQRIKENLHTFTVDVIDSLVLRANHPYGRSGECSSAIELLCAIADSNPSSISALKTIVNNRRIDPKLRVDAKDALVKVLGGKYSNQSKKDIKLLERDTRRKHYRLM